MEDIPKIKGRQRPRKTISENHKKGFRSKWFLGRFSL